MKCLNFKNTFFEISKECTCKWCGRKFTGTTGMFSGCSTYCSPKCKSEAGK